MKKPFLSLHLISLMTLLVCPFAFAADTTKSSANAADSSPMVITSEKDSASDQITADTSKAATSNISDSTLAKPSPAPTAADSVNNALAGSNLKLIKRNYNARQQVILATGMMIFVVLMMTLAQQFNPG